MVKIVLVVFVATLALVSAAVVKRQMCGPDQCEDDSGCLPYQICSIEDDGCGNCWALAGRKRQRCAPMDCDLWCENGFATDEHDCEICQCA